MPALVVRAIAFLALMALTACATVTRAPKTAPLRWEATTRPPPACSAQRFEGDGFIVCPYDPAHQTLRLVSKEKGEHIRTFAALKYALGLNAIRIAFAMNAGMFEEDGSPVGLYVENGVQQHALVTNDGTGNFYLKPNGVFFIDSQGAPHIETTEQYARGDKSVPMWATQSGPMLVSAGALNPHFQNDGPSRFVRNGAGVTAAGETFFAISETPVSFGKFARFFRDQLRCPDALYLDGNVSSLWAPSVGRQDHGRSLGPMIVVLERSFPNTQ